MLAGITSVNAEKMTIPIIVGSADVKALYPGLNIAFAIDKVCDLFYESNLSIDSINYKELGLYLAFNREDIKRDLKEVIPSRRKRQR